MDEREKHIRRIFEAALFFRDMHEECQGGHTGAIRLIRPFDVSPVVLRKYILGELYKSQGLSLTDVALHLAQWTPSNTIPPFRLDAIRQELIALCAEYERAFQYVDEPEEIAMRSFLRLARYIQRVLTEGVGAHTRIFDFFIPDQAIPKGRGKSGIGHKEHVVPCALLRDRCLELFRDGWSVDEVARWVRPYVVVVEISPEERDILDRSTSGGLGLKTSMPESWSFETGCIFARLHEARIAFEHPAGFPACAH